jgi:hypothetical protein
MNDRFWELVEQADNEGGDDPDIRDEKFGELMIAEFSDVVKQTAVLVAQTAYNDGEDAVAVQKRVDGALRVLEVLRKRFGVES